MIETDGLSAQARQLIDWLETQDYICPWGEWWAGFFNLLSANKLLAVGEQKAPTPLILHGWYISGNLDKWVRFCEQVRWADQHGVIDDAEKYIRDLPADCWHLWHGSKYP